MARAVISRTKQPSLLADWNAYAASTQAPEEDNPSALGFDLEAAARTANDRVSGTFNVVSKGVRYIPARSFQSSYPSGESPFGLLSASG